MRIIGIIRGIIVIIMRIIGIIIRIIVIIIDARMNSSEVFLELQRLTRLLDNVYNSNNNNNNENNNNKNKNNDEDEYKGERIIKANNDAKNNNTGEGTILRKLKVH